MANFADPQGAVEKRYGSIKDILTDMSQLLIPPERVKVSEAAQKYRVVYNPPVFVDNWDSSVAPYLDEVMDTLESRDYTSVCMVSAAQSVKTEGILNWLAYNVKCDPSDFMIVEKSQTEAKNFSMMKVDRMIRHSPDIQDLLIQRRTADNVFDKKFKSGTYLTITWPTKNSAAGKTVRRVALTDYDRMPQDVGGEGAPFDLYRRRTNSYKRLGMTYVESSPSFDVLNPRWRHVSGSHEAPPCDGILGIYNRGDRRRRYWQCPHCGKFFEPSFATLRWPDSSDPMESAEQAFMACPHCFEENGAVITQSMRPELDHHGVWLAEGLKIDSDRKIHGKARRSDIASFWLKGPNTAFGQWKTLVINYLLAMQEYESTGNDRPLKTTVNTDQGEAYIPPYVADTRAPEDLMDRAIDIGEKLVPENVRFLIASIDVQKNMFIVQVHGVIPAPTGFDLVVIDRFEIRKSKRLDEDGERYWVNPGSYLEDWDLITEQVIDKTYETDESTPRKMAVKFTLCDSGGRSGVTTNSYNYYRRLSLAGYSGRFMLVKGGSQKDAPRIRKTFPDSDRKDRRAGGRGEIPVLLLNPDLLKDWLDMALGREEPGGDYIFFNNWLDLNFFKELCAEIKTPKGWENPKKLRNESTDLLCYCFAGLLYLRAHKIDWGNPPRWADTWDDNPLVTEIESSNPVTPVQSGDVYEQLKKLSENLA